ncbi:MAG: GtrA family protein [Mycobacteriales bacterium]
MTRSQATAAGYARDLYVRFRQLIHEAFKFGVAGLATAVLDIAIFGELHRYLEPLLAKAISTTVAAVTSYFINRHWAFTHRARTGTRRELVLFVVLSAIGLAIAEVCLGTSHYLLDLRSPLDDQLSANGIGLVLGTLWRFWSFKRWVFLPVTDELTATQEAVLTAPV